MEDLLKNYGGIKNLKKHLNIFLKKSLKKKLSSTIFLASMLRM